MIPVNELQQWLNELPEGAAIGIDEGGLTLVALHAETAVATGCYLEIGGVPNTCLDCGRVALDIESWEHTCPECQQGKAAADGVTEARCPHCQAPYNFTGNRPEYCPACRHLLTP